MTTKSYFTEFIDTDGLDDIAEDQNWGKGRSFETLADAVDSLCELPAFNLNGTMVWAKMNSSPRRLYRIYNLEKKLYSA